MKMKYINKAFRSTTVAVIAMAATIIDEYQANGYDLTLRQLYYQFVARDLLDNTEASYNRLGTIINEARLAGMIDWNSIVDRTRNLKKRAHWDSPSQILQSARDSFYMDRWTNQYTKVEVWIEKDALTGVLSRVCRQLDVPYFSCRGYVSQSEMWRAGQRVIRYLDGSDGAEVPKDNVIILHLGDHDPSGMDMSRDLQARLDLFGANAYIKRIALNMDQIQELNPPPNPAKLSDSRCAGYINEYGDSSWELDALSPEYIEDLVRLEIENYIDPDLLAVVLKRESYYKQKLSNFVDQAKDL